MLWENFKEYFRVILLVELGIWSIYILIFESYWLRIVVERVGEGDVIFWGFLIILSVGRMVFYDFEESFRFREVDISCWDLIEVYWNGRDVRD